MSHCSQMLAYGQASAARWREQYPWATRVLSVVLVPSPYPCTARDLSRSIVSLAGLDTLTVPYNDDWVIECDVGGIVLAASEVAREALERYVS